MHDSQNGNLAPMVSRAAAGVSARPSLQNSSACWSKCPLTSALVSLRAMLEVEGLLQTLPTIFTGRSPICLRSQHSGALSGGWGHPTRRSVLEPLNKGTASELPSRRYVPGLRYPQGRMLSVYGSRHSGSKSSANHLVASSPVCAGGGLFVSAPFSHSSS